MKAVAALLLGFCLSSTFAGGIVSTLDHASLEAAIRGGGVVQITTPGTLRLTNTFTINTPTEIEATVPGVILDGGANIQAFSVISSSLRLSNLTLTKFANKTADQDTTSFWGGAIYAKESDLEIENCQISLNTAGIEFITPDFRPPIPAFGGAIFAERCRLAVTNCIFSSNTVISAGYSSISGASDSRGGALYLIDSQLFGSNLTFLANSVQAKDDLYRPASAIGGAIRAEKSVIKLSQSILTKNNSHGFTSAGGGVNLDSLSSTILENCIFNQNSATSYITRHAADITRGGAIANYGTLSVANSIFNDNQVESRLIARGGAINNEGVLRLQTSSFVANRTLGGTAWWVISETHAAGNAEGGAIYNSNEIQIRNSTFSHNRAEGGPSVYYAGPGSPIIQLPGSASGGAIFASGTNSIESVTFYSNVILGGQMLPEGRRDVYNGNAIFVTNGHLHVSISIFDGSTNQVAGTSWTDLGGNVTSDTFGWTAASLTNTNSGLGLLSYNGGFTPTIPLMPGSPAINIGPVAEINTIDQRNYLRPAGERIDSGAFEFYPWGTNASTVPTNTFSVTTSHHDSTGEVNFSQGTIATGALLFLEATPGSNSGFLGRSGSITSKSPQLFLTVTQDLQLTASFAILRSLTISNSNPSAGHISLTNATYPEGESVSVTATPNRGSRFARWEGTYNSTNNPFTFTLEADTQLTAVFEQAPSYIITANATGSGTVNPSSTNLFEGETLTLQANPSPNNRFTDWTGSFSSIQNPLIITVTSNINLTANFQPTLFRLHFHDNTGLFAHWEGSLSEITHAQLDWPLGEPNRMPTYWQLASAADRFKRWDNGEAYLDLVWRGAQGEVAYWQVNNKSLQMASGQTISGPANLGSWILAGGPYFDSANAFGLLWLHPPTGHLGTWFGTNQQAQVFLPPNSGWELIKARDFDSDGDADLLWQHNPTGTVALWKGTQLLTSLHSNLASQGSLLTSAVPGWRVVDLVDLNADGHLDLLWQSKTTGAVAVWLLHNLQLPTLSGDNAFIIPKNGPAFYHSPGPQWRIFAVKTSF